MKVIKSLLVISYISLYWIFSYSMSEEKTIKIVTTFSDYSTIAKEIGREFISVDYLSHGDQDPHFVPPKPSLALKLKDADLLIATGLDLEVWVSTLIDKSRNKKIMDGAVGYVAAYAGIDLLQKSTTALSRAEGDIHIYGNPHIHTSPLNWKVISENILIGLQKVDPKHSEYYEKNQKSFIEKVDRALFGDELVDLIGGEELSNLLRAGTLWDLLEKEYMGDILLNKLGGWLKKALPFRNKEVIAYHKNWAYFVHIFDLNVVGYIETKPGIPPTPKHVEQTIRMIREREIDLMLVASYFEKRKPNAIAIKTGINALFLPLSVGAISELSDNFKLIDYWIESILNAIAEKL
jgi:ABC-type Zn uptake system ZnuABC Zn-binding protein ZnuA